MKIARYGTCDIMAAIHNYLPEPGMSHMQECHTILTWNIFECNKYKN